MYVYSGRLKETHITAGKAALLFLLVVSWVGIGLIGHDPWKPNEAYDFGIIHHFIQSGDWLLPQLSGQPYFDKPPLYYWTASAFAFLMSPWLPLHDGARLASGFYTALTLLFIGFSGRELFGKYRGWPAAVALIGCLGMLLRAHEILADNAFLAGCAVMLYGYALSVRRPQLAGLFIGTGLGIGFLSKGFIAPVLFIAISLTLLLFRNWRTRTFLSTLAIAVLCALPWLSIWPWLLYQHSPALFTEWAWTRNIGRWLEFARSGHYPEVFYYLTALPWMAWPAAPLAAWTVWEARKRVWHEAEFQLLLTALLVMLVALSIAPDINDKNGLPLLLPVALLATASLSTLRRGAANALDWFGIMTFALLAILLWWGWAGLLLNNNAKITHWLKDYQPGFEPAFEATAFWIAFVSTLLWMAFVWRTGRSVRRSLINWASGITLIWILVMTLWRPWLDSGKSYRYMVEDLTAHLPQDYACITGSHLGISEKAMLEYFGDFKWHSTRRAKCDLLLVQGERIAKPIESGIGWEKIWEGSRQGENSERFRLYRHIDN
ncbi:ArnT family glycosyltransferase [Ferrigenium sp. UT5]|uniref:ArnT family glycosyltransferase n=1 Tax=Ferrigenium sp. UT5 TaxID=3242105 RepID=UPI00354B3567